MKRQLTYRAESGSALDIADLRKALNDAESINMQPWQPIVARVEENRRSQRVGRVIQLRLEDLR